MHSLNHLHLVDFEAADRVRRAPRIRSVRPDKPPLIRGRAAYAAARLARRLDSESARRAVA
jgi:hypothetical protein